MPWLLLLCVAPLLAACGPGGPFYVRLLPPPLPPPFCTHTLATVNCWSNPEALAGPVTNVADGPSKLTPAQEAFRTRGWVW